MEDAAAPVGVVAVEEVVLVDLVKSVSINSFLEGDDVMASHGAVV